MKKIAIIAGLVAALLSVLVDPAFGQQCRPEMVSGTGSGNPYFVMGEDGVIRSRHAREQTAIQAAVDSAAARGDGYQFFVRSLFESRWHDRQGRDCSPPSPQPTPPDSVEPEPVPPDTVPTPPDTSLPAPNSLRFVLESGEWWAAWSPVPGADDHIVYWSGQSQITTNGPNATGEVWLNLGQAAGAHVCVAGRVNGAEGARACGDVGGSTPTPSPPPSPAPSPSPPPSPSGGLGPGAHEPSGMTAIIDEDGCTKNWGSQWQYGQRWQTHVTSVGDAASPTGCAIQFLYETGKDDGFSGGAFWNNWGVRPATLYQRYFVWLSPNWQQHSSGVTKLPYWGAGIGNQASASEFVATYTQTSNFNVVDQSSTGEEPSFRGTGLFDPRGHYVEVEILQYLGTPGNRDGWVRAWLDGVEIRPFMQWAGGVRKEDSLVGWQFLNASEPWGFKGYQFAFYWGGCCGDSKQHDDYVRVGGLYLSGK